MNAALSKARSLAQHLQGADKSLAQVSLTAPEAWELLELVATYVAGTAHEREFLAEWEAARAANSPWAALEKADVSLLGFKVGRCH